LKKAISGVIITAAAVFTALAPSFVQASEASDLSSQLTDKNRQAAEASEKVADVGAQLATVQAQIDSTNAQIAVTNQQIEDAKVRMAASQAKLNELIDTEYKNGNETKLEILMSSGGISNYVDQQEYLKSGQDKIAAAVSDVIQAKREAEAKSRDLTKLQAQLADAQKGLVYAKAQADNQLAQIDSVRNDLKAKLAKYGGRVVQVGDRVNTGDLIGFEGTSGCSTGPHLHFEVQQNGSPVNPRNFTPGRLQWPLEGGFGINQEFGRPNWAAPYSFHTGMDIAQYYGAPVYAAGSGTVIFSGYDRSGFGDHVMIDHGGGLVSLYGHMGARASDYPNC
jgi:septal ring factor EnvC (AmiA/AmiB activator)